MTDEILDASDSTGATEAEVAQDAIEGAADTSSEDEGGHDEPTYYEVEDIRATADELREWKKAHDGKKSQDADYTRKSQANSKERDQLKADRDRLGESLSMLSELESEISELVMGDLNKLDMDALRDSDPSEYLRVKELRDQRAKWRDGLGQKLTKMQEKVAQESFKKLSELNGWDDTESGISKRDTDLKAIEAYVKETGMDQRSFAKILDPHVMTSLLEAAKYRELMKSKPTINKRVVQAPKTSKPSQSVQTKPLTLAEKMYGKKS
jgi:hypothetical protein